MTLLQNTGIYMGVSVSGYLYLGVHTCLVRVILSRVKRHFKKIV